MNRASSKGFIRPFHSKPQALSRTLDGGLIIASLYVSARTYDVPFDQEYILPCLIAAALFGLFAENNEIYHEWRGEPMFDQALLILVSWLVAFAITISGVFLYRPDYDYSKDVVNLWLPLAPFSIILLHTLERGFLSFIRCHGFNTKTYAIFGANPLGVRLKAGLSAMPWLGYRFLGYFDDRSEEKDRRLGSEQIGEIAGGFEELLEKGKTGDIDHIYITLPLAAEKRISLLIQQLADSTVSVSIVPDFFTFNLIQSKWNNIQGIPVVSVFDTPFNDLDSTLKRCEDLVLCMVILPLIAIPMLLIAAAVKLNSPGPAVFKQNRYGVKGEKIEVWKFRSMTVCENGDDIKQATPNDSRVTPLGAFLRKTSLDELPQFINVLQGTMSVVGPRPHAIAHNEYYRKRIQGYMLRHKVKPGITGLAQISGCRGETDTLDKMEARIHHDLEYLKQWSLWLDLKIVLVTIFKGFSGDQAY
jgi:putative colanic acid biosynthesis UDP-glucose lipid carrier transferase